MEEFEVQSSGGDTRIIAPGEEVSRDARNIPGCYVANGKTYAAVVSLLREGRVVPLKGLYVPVSGDYVVGIVTEARFSGYLVELHSPYEGNISSRETREEFKLGDVVSAKIAEVNEVNEAILVQPRTISGGTIIEIDAVKIPRVIGRSGSMLQMITDFSGTELFVGKNGRIYLRGGDVALAGQAINKIAAEAHTSGLTDRVKAFLESESGKSPK